MEGKQFHWKVTLGGISLVLFYSPGWRVVTCNERKISCLRNYNDMTARPLYPQTPKFKVLLNCSSTTPILYNQCIKPRSLLYTFYTYRWWKAFPSILWYGRWRWVIHWFIVIQENDICLPMKCFKLLHTMYISPPMKSWHWYMFSQVSHFYTLFFITFCLFKFLICYL